jgi:hypothetical protein
VLQWGDKKDWNPGGHQGEVYSKIIAEVIRANAVTFEEEGVDKSVLQELEKVSWMRACSVPGKKWSEGMRCAIPSALLRGIYPACKKLC